MGSFRRSPGLGIILLAAQVFNVGIERVPPVTLVTLTGMVALFLRIIHVPWNLYDVCLSAKSVLTTWDAKRLCISTFEHADDMHLYYNMVSFMWKGMTLENKLSSRRFACLIVVFVFLVNIVYILLAVIASELLNDYSYVEQCAVGFSGVIFALKVLTTYYMPGGMATVFGITIPRRWAVWLELVLIQLLVPNVSGLGHLAGILVGLLYVHTPLRRMIDFISCTPSLEFEISPNPNQFIVCYYESGPMIVPLSPSENARILPEEKFRFSPPLSVRLPTTSSTTIPSVFSSPLRT